jgi:anti-sigma B factor antagonist
MDISIRPQGDVRILVFKEGLDEGHSPDLRGGRLTGLSQAVKGLLDQGCRQFVVDLGAVTFVDSAGLGELIACRKRTVREGGDIRLLHATGKLRERLEMLHLTRLFGIFDDESEALASFGVNVATDA